MIAMLAVAGGLSWLAVFLVGQGLERASWWATVLVLFVTLVAAAAGAGALWLAWVGLREARRSAAKLSSGERSTPEEGSSASAKKVWNIPAPSRTFGERGEELISLSSELREHSARRAVALHGLPGVGKTQIAAAYAARQRASVQVGWWIQAETRQTVLVALSELADRLAVGDQDQERAARRALEELSHRENWLVVFDGAGAPKDLVDLVPAGDGEVLITSVDPGWDAVAAPVRVEPFDAHRAAEFLQRRTADQNPEAAASLAADLGGLPLALEQAAAYCRQVHIGLAAYLQYYRSDRALLLERGVPSDYRLPVTVTWQRSFRLAARHKPAAVQLLRIFAYLDSTNIPRDLPIHGRRAFPRALRRTTTGPLVLNDIVERLSSLSLLTADQA